MREASWCLLVVCLCVSCLGGLSTCGWLVGLRGGQPLSALAGAHLGARLRAQGGGAGWRPPGKRECAPAGCECMGSSGRVVSVGVVRRSGGPKNDEQH